MKCLNKKLANKTHKFIIRLWDEEQKYKVLMNEICVSSKLTASDYPHHFGGMSDAAYYLGQLYNSLFAFEIGNQVYIHENQGRLTERRLAEGVIDRFNYITDSVRLVCNPTWFSANDLIPVQKPYELLKIEYETK